MNSHSSNARAARAFVALAPLLAAALILLALNGPATLAQAAPNGQYPVVPTVTPLPTTPSGGVPYPVVPTATPVPPAPTNTPPPAAPTATPVPPTNTPAPTPPATTPGALSPTVTPTKPAAPAASATSTAAAATATPAGAATRTATPASGQAAPTAPAFVATGPEPTEEGFFQSAVRTVLTGLGTIWLICGVLIFLAAALSVIYLFRGARRRRQ